MVANLSSLLFQLLVPCLLLSTLGRNLDAATLAQSAGLVIWAVINIGVSFLVAYFVLPRCVRVPRHLFVPFLLAMTFNNSGSLPIVLMEPLARSPVLASDPTAYQRAIAYIWVYNLFWQTTIWGIGAPAAERDAAAMRDVARAGRASGTAAATELASLKPSTSTGDIASLRPATPTDAGGGAAPSSPGASARRRSSPHRRPDHPGGDSVPHLRLDSGAAAPAPVAPQRPRGSACASACSTVISQVLTSPPVVAIAVGALLGLVPILGATLFEDGGALRPLGSVIDTLGAAMVGMSNLVLAGSLYHGSAETLGRVRGGSAGPCCPEACVRRGPACCCEAEVAAAETEDDGAVPPLRPGDEEHLSWCAIAAMVVVRLLLAPALAFALYAGAQALRLPLLVPPGGSMASPEAQAAGTDPVIFVVALVEACTPSAQFALVITQKAGMTRAAEALSLAYLVMYPVSLVTMPLWITLALSLVFGG